MDIRETAVPYQIWGEDDIEAEARQQIERAARLPISIKGALMPDAHMGYGLPIGGVLATEKAVIPYAVGVDIACRMRMTVFDVSPHMLNKKRDNLRDALEENTLFGAGGNWTVPHHHAVLDDPAFDELEFTRERKDLAWEQLGSSGSGNHFVEFGVLEVRETISGDGTPEGEGSQTVGKIPPGRYLALLSHSGSRGFGFQIANHYTQIAMEHHPELPKDYRHLAWLDLDSEAGQEYWRAMNLAGRYASANHAVIHQNIVKALRYDVLGSIENHHNFAWIEEHDGREVVVHRKGATPAELGVYGVIPGTMEAPGYVVRGKGNPISLNSAAHGAGRRMSRRAAKKSFSWEQVSYRLKKSDVELLSAGLDESPGAYKDIQAVMTAQADLVEIMAEFQPRLVKMDADKTWRSAKKAGFEAADEGKSPDRKRYKKDKRKRRK
jgi:tRNA-splicing ligase RtcB